VAHHSSDPVELNRSERWRESRPGFKKIKNK
jgi:hypothetical protein